MSTDVQSGVRMQAGANGAAPGGPGRGVEPMKCLIIYHAGGRWFGSEVAWKRSGSGFYREIMGIEVPQSRAEIEQFAKDNQFAVEWRGPLPVEPATSSAPSPKP